MDKCVSGNFGMHVKSIKGKCEAGEESYLFIGFDLSMKYESLIYSDLMC